MVIIRVLMGFLIAISGVLIIGGSIGWGLYMMGRNTTLTCQRVESNQVNCTLIQSHWLGLVNEAGRQFNQVQHARSESYICRDSKGRTQTCHDLVIQTQSGDVHLQTLPTDLDIEINHFLDSERLTWSYTRGTAKRLSETVLMAIIMLIGTSVGAAFASIGRTAIFDTATQRRVMRRNK